MEEILQKYPIEELAKLVAKELFVLLAPVLPKGMPERDVITVKEAAAFLGRSPGSLYAQAHANRIPHYREGGTLLFRRSELDQWLSGKRVATNEEINSKAATLVALNRLNLGRKRTGKKS